MKPKTELDKLINKLKVGYLAEEEWRNLTTYLFPNEDDLFSLLERINNFIQKNNDDNSKQNKISYQKLVQIIIEFQIRLRGNYLRNFNDLFRKYDTDNNGILNEDQFASLIMESNVFEQQSPDEKIQIYLNELDPFGSNIILYSDIIDILSKDYTTDVDPETGETIELSILDKMSIQYDEGDLGEEKKEEI